MEEHDGIRINAAAIRQQTLQHGKARAALAPKAPLAAKQIVTEMDGRLIPIVQPAQHGDKRQGKTLAGREVRGCCARAVGQESRRYGAAVNTWRRRPRPSWERKKPKAGCVGSKAGY